MELHEYARHDATGLRQLMNAGDVTAAEIEAIARRALETVNPVVNGLAQPVFTPALDRAGDGPLHGVPFLIKDSGPVAQDVRFSCGSRSLEGVRARHDSDLMTRFRAAGLVTLGQTIAPELALSFSTEPVKYGPTRNPWNLERGVGGSSGGAAALVAAGAVPIAHANDGVGSTRIPASCCGLVGLKPSRGRTPCGPDTGELLFGLGSEFVLTRTVRDAAHCLDAIQGPGVGDKYTAPPPPRCYAGDLGLAADRLRVAVTADAWSGVTVDPEVGAAAVHVADTLENMGHAVTYATPDVDWDAVMQVAQAALVAVAAPFLSAPRPPQPRRMEAVSRRTLKEAKHFSALDLLSAFDAQNRVTRSIGTFFTDHDLLITPTLGQLPAPHGTLRYDDPNHTTTTWLRAIFAYGPFTAPFNISGQPAISLPVGRSRSGLPIGVQLVAPYGREDLLFHIAAELEQATPWKQHVPGTYAGSHSRSNGDG